MQIRRDYSQPFFAQRRRRRRGLIFGVGVVLGGLMLLAFTQRDRLETAALEAMGMAPQPTLSAVDLANGAMNAYLSGEVAHAADQFERALAQRPDDIDIMYEYGLILIELADYAQAVELGDRAIALNVFDPRGYTLKARARVWEGDASGAIPVVLAGLEVDRSYAPLYAVLARAYANIGNIPAGLENAEIAVELDPLNTDVLRTYAYTLNFAGAYDEATEQLEIALSLNPGNVLLMMELAAQYLSADRDQEAIDLYTQVLGLQPGNARALLRLCDAYRKIGQFDTGLGYCQDAVRADPALVPAQFRLGMIRYSEPYRDFEGARQSFQACIDADPNNLECLYRLGLSHYYLYSDRLLVGEQGDPANCDQAWTILQRSLVLAQSSQDVEIIDDVRQGLGLVSRDCIAYRGALPPDDLPQPVFDLTPEITPEATVEN